MVRKVAVVLVAVLALGLASCGGSETTTLNRAELVRQIELACRDGQREAERQARERRGSGNEAFVDAILTSNKVVMDKLNSVTTSGAAKADFESFKETFGRRVELIERIASTDRAAQQRAISSLQPKIEAATRTLEQSARHLGIEGCV
ncbi:MAG TPA: hypothetical protein VFG31_07605 [Conexibacter sp.]|nr:hypothetical protein [Conexibacter sp.]